MTLIGHVVGEVRPRAWPATGAQATGDRSVHPCSRWRIGLGTQPAFYDKNTQIPVPRVRLRPTPSAF